LIGAVILGVSSWIVGTLVKKGSYPELTMRMIIIGVVSIIISFGLLVISMILRTGVISPENITAVKDSLLEYVFGHLYAYEHWFQKYIFADIEYSLGKYTFFSIFDVLGIENRVSGIYGENFIRGNIETNIYSIFRGLISDFGVFGTFCFIGLSGIVAGISSTMIRHLSNHKTVYIVIMVLIISFYLYYIISILTYTSYILAFIIFGFVLYLSEKLPSVGEQNAL
jgi:oligosaccharide repeat unit polymerase